MLRSLSSGVAGLQAHQIAMDVISNNIANVDTTGFKYSRANFANLLSQVSQVPTGPQGNLGGTNGTSVGLGTSIGSTTKIFSEGSITTTGRNTDAAINGNGFFIVSPDGGKTLQYTRDGSFQFDADGNFVNNSGQIVQGWLRNPTTNKVDTTAPIAPIQISPALTTPAQPSSKITLQANLNSGNDVTNFSAISALDRFPDAVDLNNDGVLNQSDSLSTPQTSYQNYLGTTTAGTKYYSNSGTSDYVNENTSSDIFLNKNGVRRSHGEDMGVMTNATGTGFALQSGTVVGQGQGEWIGFRNATTTGNSVASGAISLNSGDLKLNGIAVPAISTPSSNTAAQNALAIASAINQVSKTSGVTASVTGTNQDQIQLNNDNSGNLKNITTTVANATVTTDTGLSSSNTDTPMKQFRYTTGSPNAVGWNSSGSIYYFNTSEDLRQGMQHLLRNPGATASELTNPSSNHILANGAGPYVSVDSSGKFNIYNPDSTGSNPTPYNLNIGAYAITDSNTTANSTFNTNMQSISGALPAGSTSFRSSQAFEVPTSSSSIDIYDSLGSKHTVTMQFTKASASPTTGSTWDVMISVPSPAVINPGGGATGVPSNMVEGKVTFNTDGSLATFTPSSLNFTANNGSTPNQNINLDVGTANGFNGVTSFNSTSTTTGISQDGYTGGDLKGITINQTGTLVGSFSNGKSFGLAQMAIATFANDGGLTSNGGNVYSQSANSGNPIIGVASTGSRGSIQASALESSNVDLSKSLTQLIVIQRGYQANAKTITTSNTMLQTLLGIIQ